MEMEILNERANRLSGQMARIRFDLFFVDIMPKTRVLLDFCPVILLSIIAWMHFVGDTWFSLWLDAPTLLAKWHVIAK